jgi:hypothetical protein
LLHLKNGNKKTSISPPGREPSPSVCHSSGWHPQVTQFSCFLLLVLGAPRWLSHLSLE